jgi:hypothetical protein
MTLDIDILTSVITLVKENKKNNRMQHKMTQKLKRCRSRSGIGESIRKKAVNLSSQGQIEPETCYSSRRFFGTEKGVIHNYFSIFLFRPAASPARAVHAMKMDIAEPHRIR